MQDDAPARLSWIWLLVRLVPLVLLMSVAAIAIDRIEGASGAQWDLRLAGFGIPAIAGILWSLRRRFLTKETIAGAARVATILSAFVVAGLVLVAGSH